MRYQNLKSFQKHIENAAPNLLCRMYLIAIGDDFERGKAFDLLLKHLPGLPIRFSGANCDVKDFLDAIGSQSLFGESVVILDEVEKLAKKEQETIASHLTNFSGYLLFGARSKTAPLSASLEKEGVILDLLEEKPWDKEKRLSEHLIERAKKAGKTLALDAVALFFERLGVDLALLESEIDKLICYVGERSVIAREDIFAISPEGRSPTFWQTAEEVIWEGGEFPLIDSNAFHALIPALRGQLHLGLTLSVLIEEKRSPQEWGRYLPKLWPKTLEKRSSQAARLGSFYFRKGLESLFAIELQSRSDSTQYRALLDLFRAQFYAR